MLMDLWDKAVMIEGFRMTSDPPFMAGETLVHDNSNVPHKNGFDGCMTKWAKFSVVSIVKEHQRTNKFV
jgi:hypothetical protein